jgi:CRP-like cAMP-binding protein
MPGDPEAALDQGPMDATGERFQDRHTADEPEVSRCICSSLTIWCISRTSFCLYDLGFQSLRQREFVSLALLGEWKSAEPGERVVTEGKSVSGLCISITGSAEVRQHSDRIGTLRPGHIIGTSLALTGAPSPVEIAFTEPARYMRWSVPNLRSFMDKRPDLRVTLQHLVNRDLAGKLEKLLSP